MNPKNRTPIIVGAVVVAILALAGIALAISGGEDEPTSEVDESVPSLSDDPVPSYSDEAESFRPVEVAGDALPPHDPAADPASDAAIGLTAPVVTGADFDGNPMTLGVRRPTRRCWCSSPIGVRTATPRCRAFWR